MDIHSESAVTVTGNGSEPMGAGTENDALQTWFAEGDKKRFLVGVHLNAKQLSALERYRAALDDEVSRPQAIRSILTSWLRQNGHY